MPRVYPKSNLPVDAINWGRVIQDEQIALRGDYDRLSQAVDNNNKQNTSSFGLLSQQLARIQAQVNTLNAIANVQYAEFTTGLSGFAGFTASPASVTINSSTGRIEVGYGGSLNGGTGYFVYQVTGPGGVIISRAAVQANPAQRVAVSGGASFAPSGYKNVVVNVPANVLLTVSLEIYATDTFTFFFGGSIQARVAP